MIDLYCERLDAGLWAEPVNAFTNLSFLLAAFASWRLGKQYQATLPGDYVLIGLMVAIGLGSGLFHTLATRCAQLADIIPILLYQLAFLWLYGRRIINLQGDRLAVFIVLYIVAALICRQFPHILNGSLTYAPAFIMLLVLGIYHYKHAQVERSILLVATGTFSLSLFFRTIDLALCDYFPMGTHFLWHLFNGLLVYLAFRALIVNSAFAVGEGQ